MWERRLVVLSVGLIVFWVLATVLAVAQGWPAEFNGLGDPGDVSGEWASRGTLVSPPVFPLAAQVALTLVLFLDRRLMLGIAGFGLAVLGAVYAIAGFGEPFDPTSSEPPVALYAVLKGVGIAGSLGLVWAGVETGVDAVRGRAPES
jgi:hypothetical protein